jgi:2-oxo-4-hydroxy-4-carboxy-5-ureidoimidazoline decarboxylase
VTEHAPITVADFDDASPADAAAELVPCCASRRWVAQIVKGRPYGSLNALTRASTDLLGRFSWADVLEALAAYPRVGATLGDVRLAAVRPDRQAVSRTPSSGQTRDDLVTACQAYEQQFDHAFLICATGLSGEQVLAAARSRVHNDPVAEQQVVRAELARIVAGRLGRAFVNGS